MLLFLRIVFIHLFFLIICFINIHFLLPCVYFSKNLSTYYINDNSKSLLTWQKSVLYHLILSILKKKKKKLTLLSKV